MNSEQSPLVETVFHHLVLPPKLPRGDDLLEGFRTVAESEVPIWLALHVTQQNAALLIHRDASGENIIFESFQVSAPVRDVLNANHALTWDFPSRAVSVPLHVFNDASFQQNLADFLEQSGSEAFDQFAARAYKGGQSVVEARDCPKPAIVNDMLMSLLEGLGNPVTVRQVRKRVRDDYVLDSSETPWRRSPYWLVLRVTVGRLLCAMSKDERIGRAKLCRRLAKLESEKQAASDTLRLVLPNSGPILLDLLSQESVNTNRGVRLDLPSLQEGTISQVNQLTARYTSLTHRENNFKRPIKSPSHAPQQVCIELSTMLNNYLKRAENAYRDSPVLMSQYLLRLFKLWVDMDQAAVAACPLLEDYHPVFIPHALDVLCLMTMEEMEQLARVQEYIAARVKAHTKHGRTIFSNPRYEPAFAYQFVYNTSAGHPMADLVGKIDKASEESRKSKESELEDLTERYRKLTQEIQDVSCTCTRLPGGRRETKGCQRCKKLRARKALKIMIHEDFLPSDKTDEGNAHCAAIVYELLIPEYLAGYRQATWNLYLLGSLPTLIQSPNPMLVLNKFDKLKDFTPKRPADKYSITMASRKKLFSQTHYRKMKLPKQPHEILRSFGAEFSYYDEASGFWADELPETPWFQHLFGPWLPEGVPDPYENCDQSNEEVYHPTSSDIIANEIDCPRDMSIHEFSAYQRVVSGRGRRWLAMLIELSSSNINFSSEITTTLFTRLALQAGPAILEGGTLREAHIVFREQPFCKTLHERFSSWLAFLESNCREVHCMGTIATLSLRLYHLCLPDFKEKALDLLVRIRHITSNWIVQLRNDVRVTPEGETARKSSDYALRAALLCRQTFSIYADSQGPHAALGSEDVQCFFRASIALQEHLLVSVDELSPALKHLLVQDLYTCYRMRV
ncbi:hypothetical protein LRP88_12767 [Fusarium phalaenopsidis]